MKDNLWERLLPQAREMILSYERQCPSTTEVIIKHLEDSQYHNWTELPYFIVKFIHERIYNANPLELIEEEEVRMLFEQYYD